MNPSRYLSVRPGATTGGLENIRVNTSRLFISSSRIQVELPSHERIIGNSQPQEPLWFHDNVGVELGGRAKSNLKSQGLGASWYGTGDLAGLGQRRGPDQRLTNRIEIWGGIPTAFVFSSASALPAFTHHTRLHHQCPFYRDGEGRWTRCRQLVVLLQ